jgi:pimeloyl-ACP methyl ester carboxylesterase
LLFTIWISTGMGLALIFGWLTMRYLLQKSFHHGPIPQRMKPEEYQLSAREIFLSTRNRKKIQVFSIGEENTGPLVLCIHGYENTAEKFFPLTQFLVKNNYRILLLNTRNHGGSDTDGYSTMIQFGEDLGVVCEYAFSYFGVNTPIILTGHSLGGATVIYKSVQIPNITAVISIASFADLREVLTKSFLGKHFSQSLLPLVFRYIEWSLRDRLDNLSPLQIIKQIKCPLLLLHGDKDKIVPVQALYDLREVSHTSPLQSKIIKGADHSSLLDDRNTFTAIHDFICSLG